MEELAALKAVLRPVSVNICEKRVRVEGGTWDHSRVLRPQSGLTQRSLRLLPSRLTSRKVLILPSMNSTLHAHQHPDQSAKSSCKMGPVLS